MTENTLDQRTLMFGDLQIRIVMKDGEPWFIASDIGRVLEMTNVRASVALLDDDERCVNTIYPSGKSGNQNILLVSEPGFYRLVAVSRKPVAKPFQRWVSHEVLPMIRRTGTYVPESAEVDTSMWIDKIDWTDSLNLAQLGLELTESITSLILQNSHLEVEVKVRDDAMEAAGLKSVSAVAKELYSSGLFFGGRNKLYSYLREQIGWVMQVRDPDTRQLLNEVKQNIIAAGYMQQLSGTYWNRHAKERRPSSTPVFTPKGVIQLRKILDPKISSPLSLEALGSPSSE